MKTVAGFLTPDEAHLLRLHLQSQGIPSFLRDETSSQLTPGRLWATGGVRLEVEEKDLPAALLILAETKPPSLDAKPAPNEAPPDDTQNCLSCGNPLQLSQTRCKRCGWSYEA